MCFEEQVKAPNAGAGCCTLVINGILAYFFYTYASTTDNPDGTTSCWAVEGTEDVYPDKAAATAASLGTADPVDVSAEMRSWFFTGFILMCASLSYVVMTFVYQAVKRSFLARLTHVVGCIQVLALVVWIIIGSMLRFSTIGKACSGDYYTGEEQVEPYVWQAG